MAQVHGLRVVKQSNRVLVEQTDLHKSLGHARDGDARDGREHFAQVVVPLLHVLKLRHVLFPLLDLHILGSTFVLTHRAIVWMSCSTYDQNDRHTNLLGELRQLLRRVLDFGAEVDLVVLQVLLAVVQFTNPVGLFLQHAVAVLLVFQRPLGVRHLDLGSALSVLLLQLLTLAFQPLKLHFLGCALVPRVVFCTLFRCSQIPRA